jgi:hypothetical protein
MKRIPLTQGLVATVDDEDFDELNQSKWFAVKDQRTYYAVRRAPANSGPRGLIRMHRVIADTPPCMHTDHIDGDGLNNTRLNLRVVSNQQNQHNQNHKQQNATSQSRGVCWDKRRNKWQANIAVDSKNKFLGYFDSEHAAARAYDAAGFERDPEHFTPNFPRHQQGKK